MTGCTTSHPACKPAAGQLFMTLHERFLVHWASSKTCPPFSTDESHTPRQAEKMPHKLLMLTGFRNRQTPHFKL